LNTQVLSSAAASIKGKKPLTNIVKKANRDNRLGFMGASEPFMGFVNPVLAIFLSFANINNEYNIIPLYHIAILNLKTPGTETVNA
jgi:hypothetical protein